MVETQLVPSYAKIADQRFDLGSGVSCQWRFEGRILVFYGSNATPSAADIWAAATIQAFNFYFKDQPLLAMHIMNNLPLTPYIRKKTAEVSQGTAQLHGRVAVILRPTMFTPIIKKFVDYDLRNLNSKLLRQIFTAENLGEKWLLEAMEA